MRLYGTRLVLNAALNSGRATCGSLSGSYDSVRDLKRALMDTHAEDVIVDDSPILDERIAR